MKTAMQELISELKSIESYDPIVHGVIKRAEYKLEKEKEQIIDAYNNGQQIPPFDYAEEYYNQTYNQNKLFTYCQREIEGQSMCDKQCEHCKEYYAPLENQKK